MQYIDEDFKKRISDKKTKTRINKVIRSLIKVSDDIAIQCTGYSLNNNSTTISSEGNIVFHNIFNSLNGVLKNTRKRNASIESFMSAEDILRMIFNLSSFILNEFNYSESPAKTKRGRRLKNKFITKYECDNKDVMQSMRDVRNLFKLLDA